MFPFQQNNDLFSQISSDPYQDIGQDQNLIILGQPDPFQTSNFTNFMEEEEQEAQLLPNTYPISNTANNDLNISISDDQKKITRKEIERQRRQQMSTLHASLRSLLPLQSLKGKRSISDHINEAAKYIKDLQINVEKLRIKRDKLKNMRDLSCGDEQRRNYESSSNLLTNRNSSSVTVSSHMYGVEIIVSCGCNEENFVLSRAVGAVVEEGLDVVNCISTRRDERLYHTIQCQATHIACVDVSALQQKLNHAIL